MLLHFRSRLHRFWPVALVLLVGLAASGGLAWRLHRQAVELDRHRLGRIGTQVRDALQQRVQTTDLVLRQGEDYFGAKESFSPTEFREWCRKYGFSETVKWLHGIAFYTNQNAGAWRDRLPADPKTWTPDNFHTFEVLANQTPIPLKGSRKYAYSHDRSKNWPTNYEGNVYYSSGERLGVGEPYSEIQLAPLANTPQTTTRQVVIEHTNQIRYIGATVAVPVYEADRDALHDLIVGPRPKAGAHPFNWNFCRGVLMAPIDYAKLESLIWGDEPREVGVEIFASPRLSADQWLNPSDHPPRALDPNFKPYLTLTVPWTLYARKWTLFLYTLPPFEAGSARYMAYVTFAAGSGITLLASALVAVALRARNRQEQMTAEVIEARDALAVAEKEREKMGHDLHDGAIQSLYAVQLGLARTIQRLGGAHGTVRQELAMGRAELDAVIAEMRRFVSNANTSSPADLAAVLRALVQRTHVGTTANIKARCDGDASERLSSLQAVHLANIAREALSNSLRHGQPQNVEIELLSKTDSVCLRVTDDGVGFDSKSTASQGVGLTSISRRVREMGGTLEIDSGPGKGTRVTILVPASTPEAAQPESGKDFK